MSRHIAASVKKMTGQTVGLFGRLIKRKESDHMRDYHRKRLCGFAAAGISIFLTINANADSSLTGTGLVAFAGGRYAEAARDWQQAVATGDGQAALYIGLMHDLGRGVPRDMQFARAWYEQAAALGNGVAMFNMGVLYDAGVGVSRDSASAIAWYRRAADAGMGRAAFALGLIYEAGDGVSASRNQAVIYYRQALASGVSASRARLLSLGALGQRDSAESQPGKNSGIAAFERAQELLLERTPQAKMEAATLLRQAADDGDLLAAYDLAYCYEHGIGLAIDRQQAAIWYRRASQSSVTTVKRAAQAGLQDLTRNLSAEEFAKAGAARAPSGHAQ